MNYLQEISDQENEYSVEEQNLYGREINGINQGSYLNGLLMNINRQFAPQGSHNECARTTISMPLN